jgi:hypothetical protein
LMYFVRGGGDSKCKVLFSEDFDVFAHIFLYETLTITTLMCVICCGGEVGEVGERKRGGGGEGRERVSVCVRERERGVGLERGRIAERKRESLESASKARHELDCNRDLDTYNRLWN